MHDIQFSRSFNPAPAIVLGLPLETYTFAHEMALQQRWNPLVLYTRASFGELPEWGQEAALRAAVLICCRRVPWFGRLWALWADRLFGPQEVDNFFAYRAAALVDLPLEKMPRVQGVPHHYFGAPELARLLNYVSAHHGLLIQAHFKGSPLNFPLGLARMLYSTHLECEGEIWVKNYQDDELRRKASAPEAGTNEKVLTGDEAEKLLAELITPALPKEKE